MRTIESFEDLKDKIFELWKEACFYGRSVDLKEEIEKLYYEIQELRPNPACTYCPVEPYTREDNIEFVRCNIGEGK